ncbi:MAG: TRAP transporter large permease subunit, partial [Thermodesulfobacteria bacterium]|nr:TRAP transporter large permease subunit [Thermodesulfobacteriota bacterium]
MRYRWWGLLLVFLWFFAQGAWAMEQAASQEDLARLNLFGRILNPHKKGVPDATISIYVNGEEIKPHLKGHGPAGEGLTTEFDGSFQVELDLPRQTIEHGEIQLEIFKPSYKKTILTLEPDDFAIKNGEYYAKVEVIIPRTKGPAFWIATVVFILAYVLISFELLHRTLAAMLGASVMLLISYTLGTFNPEYHILSYESAIHSIDMNVVFLLMGMMIIVGILKNTGVFQWCAYKCYQLARGNVIVLSLILMIFTAVSSAFLDNVTTMLLLTPVTIEIALSLGISPLSLLIPEILASNVGGTATLIG